MAELKISGRMSVKRLKENFKNEFGGTLRVYDGREKADDNATLASIRRNNEAKGGEYSCQGNRTVGRFEREMREIFGIKVQVATPDDWTLVLDGITLAKLKHIPEKTSKADMEALVAYKRSAPSSVANSEAVKTIRVRLCGQCDVFLMAEPTKEITPDEVETYDYLDDMESEGLCGEITTMAFMSMMDRLTYEDITEGFDEDDREYGEQHPNETTIIRKGAYITEPYILKKFSLPFIAQKCDSTYAEYYFDIELERDEEFDLGKLQICKSVEEVSFLPHGIVTDILVYNGKVIEKVNEPGFDIYRYSGCFIY